MVTIVCDIWITRRKSWQLCYNPDGTYRYGSKNLGDVIRHLADTGIDVYQFDTKVGRFQVQMQRVRAKKDP